jgi:hypothetical protein
MTRIALPLLALAMAGCTYNSRPETPAPAPSGKCSAEGLGDLVGKTQSEAVAKEALRRSGAKLLRWITPEMMVTMDYREDRLNLHLGTDGKIGSVRCG